MSEKNTVGNLILSTLAIVMMILGVVGAGIFDAH
jgi:hypothetical protein